jgi:histone H3/H4
MISEGAVKGGMKKALNLRCKGKRNKLTRISAESIKVMQRAVMDTPDDKAIEKVINITKEASKETLKDGRKMILPRDIMKVTK